MGDTGRTTATGALSPLQYKALQAARRQPITARILAHQQHVSRSSASAALRHLERAGLLTGQLIDGGELSYTALA